MKRVFPGLALLPIFFTSLSSASVETSVTNKVSGESASVKTEINNVVNQKSVDVAVTGPGTVKVEIKDDQIKIEPGNITPTIVTSFPEEEIKEEIREEVKEEIETMEKRVKEEKETIKQTVISLLRSIFSKFARLFRIKLDNY